MPWQQLLAIGNGNGDGDGQWRWRLQLPTVTETAMANGKGNSNGNGWWWCERDGGGDGWWWLQQQWLTATGMAIGCGNVDSGGNGDSNSDGDGNGDCNDYGHGNINNDKGTLPPPPWTQRKVHSPGLHHGGDTAKSVCSLSRGRVPVSSPWIVSCLFFTTNVQFTEHPSVCPPHYSGTQEPSQPIDTLPPPLLQEPCQPIDNLPWLLLHILSR